MDKKYEDIINDSRVLSNLFALLKKKKLFNSNIVSLIMRIWVNRHETMYFNLSSKGLKIDLEFKAYDISFQNSLVMKVSNPRNEFILDLKNVKGENTLKGGWDLKNNILLRIY